MEIYLSAKEGIGGGDRGEGGQGKWVERGGEGLKIGEGCGHNGEEGDYVELARWSGDERVKRIRERGNGPLEDTSD